MKVSFSTIRKTVDGKEVDVEYVTISGADSNNEVVRAATDADRSTYANQYAAFAKTGPTRPLDKEEKKMLAELEHQAKADANAPKQEKPSHK